MASIKLYWSGRARTGWHSPVPTRKTAAYLKSLLMCLSSYLWLHSLTTKYCVCMEDWAKSWQTIETLKWYRGRRTSPIRACFAICFGRIQRRTSRRTGSRAKEALATHLMKTLFKITSRNLILTWLPEDIKYKRTATSSLEVGNWLQSSPLQITAENSITMEQWWPWMKR